MEKCIKLGFEINEGFFTFVLINFGLRMEAERMDRREKKGKKTVRTGSKGKLRLELFLKIKILKNYSIFIFQFCLRCF